MFRVYANLFRLVFPLCAIRLSKKRDILEEDINVWIQQYKLEGIPKWAAVSKLILRYQEFRNVLYYRFASQNALIRMLRGISMILLPQLDSLYITTPHIGKGFLVMHGFATILSASYIGDYFTVFQQVTVGYNGSITSKIGDYVTISCGAKVLGVSVGDHSVVGANAVVIKDVPENTVAVGVPARMIERKSDRENK